MRLSRHALVLDVETTGLNPYTAKVVQVGLTIVCPCHSAKVMYYSADVRLADWSQLFRPSFWRAKRVHGKSLRRMMLAEKTAADVVADLEEYRKAYPDAVIAGDNVGFDFQFLKQMYADVGVEFEWDYHLLDLTGLALVHLGVVGLSKIARSLGLDTSRYTKHDALGDAMLTADCLTALLERI